ncbi:patched domain-containing protein 3-like [Scyliorhinus canicula]|uniref:patched domain-containing protein 3-like n=1 Tax=Scyliorhinus canicula TaxID=7830 RepID=UPI0018F4C408|nr:patched domain-containing protein 3-like [Scyliorhinus canicula]
MAQCQTNCIEKHLRSAFYKLGHSVNKYVWCFFTIPLILSAALGSGFYFLSINEANDIEEQFTPINGPAKSERAFIEKHFPTTGSEFSGQRLSTEGSFASLIAVSKGDNILTKIAFQEILSLDEIVKQLNITYPQDVTVRYDSLCVREADSCFPNKILDFINHSLATRTEISYPMMNGTFIGLVVGGVTLNQNDITKAKAIKLDYYLQEDNDEMKQRNLLWLKAFLQVFPNELQNQNTIRVSYFTSLSRQEEFEANSKKIIPLFSITYFLSIFFSITSCMRFDCVRNKVWVATLGVVSAGLAVLSGFGLLLFCGMKFAINTANAPFLILGIGVDDMFIMLSSWQKTKVKDKVGDRLAQTYAEAAVSITITTLTDVLAFYIGILTPFRSVQSFCVYTGTTILFCFLYNITFFGAVLALNGRREASNRHWLTFRKVEHDPKPDESKCYAMCCVGGASDQESGAESEHPVYFFFKKYYGPILTIRWTKAFVVLLYAGYLAGSIYGCLNIKEGIDVRNLAFDDSYVVQFYDDQSDFFSKYGPRVMVSVTEPVEYWNSTIQNEIEICMDRLENNSYVDRTLSESWLRTYVSISKQMQIAITEKNTFLDNLALLFRIVPLFKQDVEFLKNNQSIIASRFFIQTIYVNNSIAEKQMLIELRKLAQECKIPLLVYHPAFIYFDQYLVIVTNTIQNVAVAAAAMLVIALLFIPNPICSLWVTFATASVLVGVTGFMTFWDVNLDSISMINLVICIGFSVDFSAHISYAFVSSEKESANERSIDALYTLGYPIIQGALSTILGVVVLAAAESYIFRTFFKIMFLVITFGAVHGLIFLPVFLTFFATRRKLNSVKSDTAATFSKKQIYVNEAFSGKVISNPYGNGRISDE